MTRQELDAIRARCEAATPGPWNVKEERFFTSNVIVASENDVCLGPSGPDAEFIAASRTDIPALLDALGAAYKEVERLEDEPPHKRGELRCVVSDLSQQVREAEARAEQAEAERDALAKELAQGPCPNAIDGCPRAFCQDPGGATYSLECWKDWAALQARRIK